MPAFRWKHSLYSRAFFLTLIGSASLLGAVFVQSWVMVNGTVERLLQERITLARTTGSYVEELIHHDLDQIGTGVQHIFREQETLELPRFQAEARGALSYSYLGTIFQEGAFLLDRDGAAVASVPDRWPTYLGTSIPMSELKALMAKAAKGGPAVSPLLNLNDGRRPVLIVLDTITGTDGKSMGYVGGLLHPASNNLLMAFKTTGSTLELVDSTGRVVAATVPERLFNDTDHGSLLSGAIKQKREIQGRCHACHETQKAQIKRESQVLAFAPLPGLALGMAVRQSEEEALAPAFLLKKKLFWLGTGFVTLFLMFTALAVQSVVSPLTKLTRAVRDVEGQGLNLTLPSFGEDEVGELARALDRWRGRVLSAVTALEQKERALAEEFQVTRKHLGALQEIAQYGTKNLPLREVLERGIEWICDFTGHRVGALRLSREGGEVIVQKGIDAPTADRRLKEASEAARRPSQILAPNVCSVRIDSTSVPLLFSDLKIEPSLHLTCILCNEGEAERDFEPNRLESLIHQVLTSAANRLLHEENALRQEQSRSFLEGVLRAQEEERRRIARELHDTLAQELAAHRLEIERLSSTAREQIGAEHDELVTKLAGMEGKAHEMLVGLRQMLLDLRPSVLDTMGFLPALQWYLERLERDKGIRGKLIVENEPRLDHDREVSLFRIFQEALQNVAQHSQAERVLVTVNQDEDFVEMTMEDDGKGFEPERLSDINVAPEARRLGLVGMKERASLLGGVATIQSAAGEGTTLHVKIPISGKASERNT